MRGGEIMDLIIGLLVCIAVSYVLNRTQYGSAIVKEEGDARC